MSSEFDLIVIGAGPGGYVCAFRAQQLGLKVALVEKRATLGGTCLNVGCIPSKALLHTSEQLAWARDHAADSGIKIASVEADLPAILKKKDAVVAKLVGGVGLLAKSRKIPVYTGTAAFVSPTAIEVKGEKETTPLTAKNFVIATGSSAVELPFMKFDGATVVSSDHAIAFSEVPKKLVVVGGGAIGLELGSVWSRLGSDVTVVEFLPKIAATYDDDIVRNFTRLLQKQGLKIETGAKVTGFKPSTLNSQPSTTGTGILTAERDGQKLEFPADKVLVAVGRRPYADGLGLEKAGVQLDDKKRIKVDSQLRTNVPGIWAIGDVVAGPMLAHKAEEDGVAVAEWIAGKAGHVNWDLVPAIVYTDPEVASVGLGEDAAKAAGRAVNVGKFNFAANGRAIAADATDGFVKIIADAKTDRILGAQILGHNAGELISEIVTHMEYGGSAEDLGRTIHAHPTMTEAVKEAGLAVSKSAIHARDFARGEIRRSGLCLEIAPSRPNMFRVKKLILWDIDGTLIVSHGAGLRAMERACLERFGAKCDLAKIDWAGRTDTWIVTAVLRHCGLPETPENIHDYLEAYLKVLPIELQAGLQGRVLPGVLELLETLHHRSDVAQGLLTGNLQRGAELKLTHYRVWHYFEFGAFADDSPRRNDLGPHALRRAAEKHDVEFAPDQTFVIGDTPHDIECGKVIGARTIAVATGKYVLSELAAHAPTAAFADFADTAAFLRVIDGH